MSRKSELIYEAMANIDEDLIASASVISNVKKRKNFPIKWISVAACFVLIITAALGIWYTRQTKIEYDYSMIKTHSSSSTGMDMPYDVEDMAEWTEGFIEFVVLSGPVETSFEYVDQASIDEAIEQNYSEEDLNAIVEMATSTYTFPHISIQIENILSEKEGSNLSKYDKIWLLGDASNHSESFVPGARFAVFVKTMESDATPVELIINYYIFYIDENDTLVPFTDDPSLMQYEGYSLEDMAELTVAAAEKLDLK